MNSRQQQAVWIVRSQFNRLFDVLLRQLDIAMSPRPLNVMERPATEVIQYYYQPDLLVTYEQVGDVGADQPTAAGYQHGFVT